MQTCPNCGAPNRDKARFCSRCNTLLRPLPGTGLLSPSATLHRGRFRIVGFLKKGGMGAVYQARGAAGKLWAVKEMSDAAIDPGERPQAIADFQREAELLATLRHPNLPAALPAFFEAGKWYFALDFVRGRTLEDILDAAPGPLKEETVLGWAAQICDVLDYLHGQHPPVIFRDMKPANIMVETRTRCLKLIDFGIARLFDPRKVTDTLKMGTLGYAPPEQYAGRGQTDAVSDIYALGATLHQLATKRDPRQEPPFSFPPLRQLNPALSPGFERVILRALKYERTERFPSVAAMRQALQAGAATGRAPKWGVALGAGAAALASLLVCAGLALVLPGLVSPPPAATIAPTATAAVTPSPMATLLPAGLGTALPHTSTPVTLTPTFTPRPTRTPTITPSATPTATPPGPMPTKLPPRPTPTPHHR